VPKQAVIDDEIGGRPVLPDTTASPANSEGAKLRGYLDRIAEVQAEIDKIMENAKAACSPLREDIDEIRKEANEAGFARKELNTLIRKERLERKLERVAENLDEEQKERYEDMLHALGALADLPLGEAVAEKHPERAKH
jgi:uncharacterized protein (UPF0335 family)